VCIISIAGSGSGSGGGNSSVNGSVNGSGNGHPAIRTLSEIKKALGDTFDILKDPLLEDPAYRVAISMDKERIERFLIRKIVPLVSFFEKKMMQNGKKWYKMVKKWCQNDAKWCRMMQKSGKNGTKWVKKG
jgi:hypothetical protein